MIHFGLTYSQKNSRCCLEPGFLLNLKMKYILNLKMFHKLHSQSIYYITVCISNSNILTFEQRQAVLLENLPFDIQGYF